MNIKEYFKNWYQNWKKSLNKKMFPDDVLNERQQIGFSIFVDALNDSNCIRFLNIEGVNNIDKKYIVSKDYFVTGEAQLFITLISEIDGNSKMNIINHEYLYDIEFYSNTTRKLNKMFKEAVKRDRAKMEEAMNINVTNSLTQILIDFKERMKKQVKPMAEDELIKDEQTVIIQDVDTVKPSDKKRKATPKPKTLPSK